MRKVIWKKQAAKSNYEIPASVREELGISPRLASILQERNIKQEEIASFLYPHLRYLAQPEKWPGVTKGAKCLVDALLAGKKIVVWGDYDVDGITGVCVVLEVLHYYGFEPLWHLPERISEGYGLNESVLESYAEQGVNVLLTVDCGISDFKAIERANELGCTIIISDHHLPQELLPQANVLCNPKLGDCPCSELAGVGVAFFLMAEVNTLLSKALNKPKMDMRTVLDLVAFGTLSDIVPLIEQNRILVKNGMLLLNDAKRLGFAALKHISKMNSKDLLSTRQIVFALAPRINAAGRMAEASMAVKLFMSKDIEEVKQIAATLDKYNEDRKQEEKEMIIEALEQAGKQEEQPAIFVAKEEWNQGIVGIIASRLVEKYYKPAFVFCKDGNMWKASARSIERIHLHEALAHCAEYLDSFGGHQMAAGVRVEEKNFKAFQESFCAYLRKEYGGNAFEEVVYYDGELSLNEAVDYRFKKEISSLQPFGISNKEPVFLSPELTVKQAYLYGYLKNHIRLTLHDESSKTTVQVKMWGQARNFPDNIVGKRMRVLFVLNLDTHSNLEEPIKIKYWNFID